MKRYDCEIPSKLVSKGFETDQERRDWLIVAVCQAVQAN